MSVSIDSGQFVSRLSALFKDWSKNSDDDGLWAGTDSLAFVHGKGDEDALYHKILALHFHLFAYELTETLVVLTKGSQKTVHVLSSKKKCEHLQPLIGPAKNEGIEMVLYTRNKEDGDKASIEKLIDAMKESGNGKTVGSLTKDEQLGEFAENWKKSMEAAFKVVDVSLGIADALAVKDDAQKVNVKKAAALSARVFKEKLLTRITHIADSGRKTKHSRIAEDIERILEDPAVENISVKKDATDSCYLPIIQSGGDYNLKPSAEPNDQPIHPGTVVCSLGARYLSYCSNIGRTIFFNPVQCQVAAYKGLLEVQAEAIRSLKPGANAKAVYENALAKVREILPDYEANFTKNVGFSIGIEFKESLSLNAKADKNIKAGMCFNVACGFQNLELTPKSEDSKRNIYSVFVADTVIVEESGDNTIATASASNQWSEVAFKLEDPVEDDEPSRKKIEFGERGRRSAKDADADDHLTTEERRRKNQEELAERIREEQLKRFSKSTNGGAKTEDLIKEFGADKAYSSADRYPRDVKPNQIFCDTKHEAILMPINGYLVPFHISLVKNASKNDEGDYTRLRVNFFTPAEQVRTAILREFPVQYSTFIRELSYRSANHESMNNVFRHIKEMQKRFKQKEEENKDRDTLVVQEDLIMSRKPAVLNGLSVRPHIGMGRATGKQTGGRLEAHTNGLRFTGQKDQRIDILYRNVKHAFYQAAENDAIVLLHFTLRNEIMMGKKKSANIQFYTEVMEATEDLGQARRRGRDPDEIEDEQRERQLRQKLNDIFKNFMGKVEDVSKTNLDRDLHLEFDIPYRDLGFHGAPDKSDVYIMPTVNCLVSLSEEWPPFVISLEDIEIAYFERVSFNLKNFDLAFVFKDYDRPPVRINAIPRDSIDPVKDWLNEVNIKYYEGNMNLNWKKIMQHVNKDRRGFIEDGGWEFLNANATDSEEGDAEEEDESEFVPEDDDDDDDDDDSEEYESDEFTEDSEGSESLDSDESEGKDWDELEKEAIREEKTKKRSYSDDDSDDRKKKKKKSRR